MHCRSRRRRGGSANYSPLTRAGALLAWSGLLAAGSLLLEKTTEEDVAKASRHLLRRVLRRHAGIPLISPRAHSEEGEGGQVRVQVAELARFDSTPDDVRDAGEVLLPALAHLGPLLALQLPVVVHEDGPVAGVS